MTFRMILLLISLLSLNLQGQTNHPGEFDFFVGTWEIEQSILSIDGQWLEFEATTKVEKKLNESILVENWKGKVQFFWENMESPQNLEGYSIRYYDASKKEWKIFWMDNLNPHLSEPFIGNFIENKKGVFYKQNEQSTSKIVFTVLDETNLLWELFISNDMKTWKKIWIMKMKKNSN